jgi:hypothetical protein
MSWTYKATATFTGLIPSTLLEISVDLFTEAGETHDYTYTNAPLAGTPFLLPAVTRLTQEKITGRASQPIFIDRTYWSTNQSSNRPGQSSGYTAKIGLETQLQVQYAWAMNGNLDQFDTSFPDSSGPGGLRSWRAVYQYADPADGTRPTQLLRQAVNPGLPPEERLQSTYGYEPGRGKLSNVTNTVLATTQDDGDEAPLAVPSICSSHAYTFNTLGFQVKCVQSLAAHVAGYEGGTNTRSATRDYSYTPRGEIAQCGTSNATGIPNPQSENEQFCFTQTGERKWHSRGRATPASPPTDSTAAPAGSSTYAHCGVRAYTAVTGTDAGASPGVQKYDADANLTDDGMFTYKYDSENRLLDIVPINAQLGDRKTSFRYDWQGRRRMKTQVEFSPTYGWDSPDWKMSSYVHDGEKVILELSNYWDAFIQVNKFARAHNGSGGLLFSQINNAYNADYETSVLYTYDGSGNVSEVIGGSGYNFAIERDVKSRTLAQFRYDASGRPLGAVTKPALAAFINPNLPPPPPPAEQEGVMPPLGSGGPLASMGVIFEQPFSAGGQELDVTAVPYFWDGVHQVANPRARTVLPHGAIVSIGETGAGLNQIEETYNFGGGITLGGAPFRLDIPGASLELPPGSGYGGDPGPLVRLPGPGRIRLDPPSGREYAYRSLFTSWLDELPKNCITCCVETKLMKPKFRLLGPNTFRCRITQSVVRLVMQQTLQNKLKGELARGLKSTDCKGDIKACNCGQGKKINMTGVSGTVDYDGCNYSFSADDFDAQEYLKQQ